jgi:hypothetical protein
MERPTLTLTQRIAGFTGAALAAISVLGALLLTRRNRRFGRGDSKGALKLAGFLFAARMLGWAMGAHHVPSAGLEAGSYGIACAGALLLGAVAAVLYLAVEPYVRRRMPELMIGWARLLEGRIRDPRVGRDVLLGAIAGTASALLVHVSNALPSWIPILGQTPVPPDTGMVAGGRFALAALVGRLEIALLSALYLFFMLFLLRVALRRERAALIGSMVVLTLGNLGGENVALETPFALLQGVIGGWVLGRVGLLAVASMVLFRQVLSIVPVPIDSTTPYTLTTVVMLGLLLAIAGIALRISIGPRPLFSAAALDE